MLTRLAVAFLLASSTLLPQGIVTTAAGSDAIFTGEGRPGQQAQLVSPHGLAIDASHRLLISDKGLNQILRLEPPGLMSVFAGNGLNRLAGDGGSARAASLAFPLGIAFDPQGVVAIADNGNGRIRAVHPDGLIETGFDQLTGGPTAVAIDSAGAAEIAGTLQAAENQPPVIASRGVLNAGSFQLNAPLAPGSLVSIFGQRLADGQASADSLPLPLTLQGARATLAGRPVPLVFSSPNQLNAVLPFDIPINSTHQLVLRRGTALSVPEPVNILASQTGVFTKDLSGRGEGIIVVARGDGSKQLAGPGAPANPGDVLVIYCTGLGEVDPRAIAGSSTPITPLSPTLEPVTVTLAGIDAPVAFAGLTPGFTGLYQINAAVPAGLPSGLVPLVITQSGRSSPPVTVAIR
ncbi:MAG: hypothetical protein FJW20_24980 [Acidimicrobiia bacterium]|nr:hypothetical protein [Acidimicrobiia bacterium]